MAYIKQFLTKTRPSDNTSIFRYSPLVDSERLEIYALVSISNDVDAESSRFNKFVWDGFIDGFLQKEGDIITRLKHALIGSEFKLRELIRHDDLLEDKGVKLDLSAVVFKGNKAYIVALGDHKVLLYKDRVIDISELLSANKSNVGSMIVKPREMLLFYHSTEKVNKDFKGEDELEEYLVGVFDNEEARGGAFVAFSEEKIEEEVTKVEGEKPVELQEEMEVEVEQLGEMEDTDFEDEGEEEKTSLEVVKDKTKRFYGKARDLLGNLVGGVRERKRSGLPRPIKVGGYKERELKIKRFVTLGIFLVLFLTLFFGVKSAFDAREARVLSAGLEELVTELGEEVEKAKNAEMDDALAILSSVRSNFDEYVGILEKEEKKDKMFETDLEKINEFRSRIVKVQDGILKIESLSEEKGNIEMFLDTKLAFGEKSNPVSMTITKEAQIPKGEYIYVVDQGEKAVFEVNLKDGDPRRINDPDGLLSKPLFVDMGNNPEERGLYVYDSDVGVLVARIDENGKFNNFKALSGVSTRALGSGEITAFAVFGISDTLNFLIPSENRIIRSRSFGADSYGLSSEYISYPGFENGFELYGDLYIYALTESPNGIKRFNPQTALSDPILLRGFHKDLYISKGFTGPTMNRAFLAFDSENHRFVYLRKPIESGEELRHPGEIHFVGQFEYRGERDDVFDDVRKIVSEHSDKWMFVLDGRKIWKVNIVLD
jgi:hypothetical protein